MTLEEKYLMILAQTNQLGEERTARILRDLQQWHESCGMIGPTAIDTTRTTGYGLKGLKGLSIIKTRTQQAYIKEAS